MLKYVWFAVVLTFILTPHASFAREVAEATPGRERVPVCSFGRMLDAQSIMSSDEKKRSIFNWLTIHCRSYLKSDVLVKASMPGLDIRVNGVILRPLLVRASDGTTGYSINILKSGEPQY